MNIDKNIITALSIRIQGVCMSFQKWTLGYYYLNSKVTIVMGDSYLNYYRLAIPSYHIGSFMLKYAQNVNIKTPFNTKRIGLLLSFVIDLLAVRQNTFSHRVECPVHAFVHLLDILL